MTRRRSLEKIQKEIFQNNQLSSTELGLVFKQMMKPLLNLYSFPIDKCRELSIKMVTEYVFSFSFFKSDFFCSPGITNFF